MEKHNKPKRGSSSRLFYVALAVCAVAVTGVAVATFSTPSTDIDQPNQPTASSSSSTSTHTTTSTTTQSTTKPTTTTKPTDSVDVAGKPADLFVLPFGNEVSQSFSGDTLVYSNTMKDWRTHNGVDFVGEKGQTVKAAADATVGAISTDPLWGDVIELKLVGNIVLRYCGAKAATDLKVGDKVEVGQAIATLTEIPCEAADAPHLHVEVLTGGKYTDPVALIGREIKKYTTTGTTASTKA